jgi:SAM-dependent methyltransferase
MTDSPKIPPHDAMLGLLSGYWFSATLHAAASLGIADLVAVGPQTSAQLARATATHEPSLHRLLSALASAGIFTEIAPGTFAQSPMSETLRDAPGSLRSLAILGGDQSHWAAWGELLDGVRTGRTPFELAHGTPFFDYLDRSDVSGRHYDEAWNALGDVDSAITDVFDISRFRRIVDVGGGSGGLLRRALATAPDATGVLFDRPAVVAAAQSIDRAENLGGDFFDSVPADGDLYILKFVLHDWPEDRAVEILANCARAMDGDGRLLIAELLVPEDSSPSYARIDDLNMFVLTGGRARTEAEFRTLLDRAGLRLEHVTSTPMGFSLLEAVRQAHRNRE